MKLSQDTLKDPVVAIRLKVINHHQEYGWRSACHAFDISKTTIYRWKTTYLDSDKNALSLKKRSTKPHNFRPMQVHLEVVSKIKRLREEHYRLGKEKIKPLLDEYCGKEGLPTISESTIGKVIKRNNFFFQRQSKMYHNPGSGFAKRKTRQRLRVKHSWKPQELGHLQMDTVFKFADSLKRYAVSVMDVKSKFVLTLVYPKLTSTTALDALLKFKLVYPIPIKSIQTDNGLEFLGVFDNYLKKYHIPHLFIYPRCPRINGYIERYNRTFQEEFLDLNLHLLYHPKEFHDKLLEYLVFFNTKRVHKSLNNQTPVDYLIAEGCFSHKWVTYTSS